MYTDSGNSQENKKESGIMSKMSQSFTSKKDAKNKKSGKEEPQTFTFINNHKNSGVTKTQVGSSPTQTNGGQRFQNSLVNENGGP